MSSIHGDDLDLGIPFYTNPLNTDGIDFNGRNGTFRRIKITNWDDSIVPKPSHKGSFGGDCTQDILVEDIEVTFGVGMSIGSVPPNEGTNCIKNVLFRNVTFDKPMKAIYIKTNPGYLGDGIIKNITYENIVMHHPVWWGVYIGPQQMKEPSGDGPGCMLYPLTPCETQPRITISDITLRNVTSYGSILPAGIIRCNSTNPCKNFVFEDVQLKSLLWDTLDMGFITEFVEGTATNVHPDPGFKPIGYYDMPENRGKIEHSELFKKIALIMRHPDFMLSYMAHILKSGDPLEFMLNRLNYA